MKWNCQTLPHLTKLSIGGNSSEDIESFPGKGYYLPLLPLLKYGDFHNLEV
ncbi:hypothetical protein CsatB_021829 [Cannabis sativa]